MSRENAKSTLVHYFERSMTISGDMRAEIEGVVDDIIDTAKAEVKTEMQTELREVADGLQLMNQDQRAQNRLLASCSALKGLLSNPKYDEYRHGELVALAAELGDRMVTEVAERAQAPKEPA